jgi:hypothetical protein
MGRPEGKRPLGRPRHRWVDNALKLVGLYKNGSLRSGVRMYGMDCCGSR